MEKEEKFRFYAVWLGVLMVLIYIIQAIYPGFTDTLLLNKDAYIEVWRFLTAMFLHGGVGHLVFNLFALLMFGSLLEKFIGGKRFLAVFFLTGILANIISVNFYDASLGVSGAVFGIIGAVVVLKPKMVVWAFGMPMPMFVAAVLWAAIDFLGVFAPSNVANIAHIAGLVSGIFFGFLYYRIAHTLSNYEKRPSVKIDESSIRIWEDKYMK